MAYDTKQREMILVCLRENQSGHLTADEIYDMLKKYDLKVGRATLYRFLKVMEESGEIKKYRFSEKSAACYQYLGKDTVCNSHYHLMCENCSRVIHLESPQLDSFIDGIEKDERFRIDVKKTVFYGICDQCGNNLQEKLCFTRSGKQFRG